jgi:patatin-related protein
MGLSNTSSPTVDYTREVRFAVVMYGGVSLAVYINGIAQELLRWVRSTASDSTREVALIPSTPSTDDPFDNTPTLSGTERVYRKLSYMLAEGSNHPEWDAAKRLSRAEKMLANNEPIRTRFIVDILSGTSASEINGIYLAKALANGQDISGLENLWIKEADMSTLINDKQSIEAPLRLQDPPASLLNSERMYLELLKAFDNMENTAPTTHAPFVDELDLFVTTTDLSGVSLPIRLSDSVVYERRHRKVMRFVYSTADVSGEDRDRNDFIGDNNPFLAFAARCTSAFPVAFEPMCLRDIDTILENYRPYAANTNWRSDSTFWQRFYKDYLNPAGLNSVPFPQRAFADGGYLDNKPFTYAAKTLAHRQADLLVTRKLIYIEPSPEHPEEQPEAEGKPDAIENVGAALLSLPRHETIQEDLQRLRDHNRLVERVNSLLVSADVDLRLAGAQTKSFYTDEEWGKFDLADVAALKGAGAGYLAYHRLEIASVTDDLARLVARVAGFDEESDHLLIIRSLVSAWRSRSYVQYGKGRPTLNTFLFEFDLTYPLRRIKFLRTKISELAASAEYRGNARAEGELVEIKTKLNQEYKNLRHTARLLRSRQVPAEAGAAPAGSVPSPAYNAIQNLKAALAEAMKRMPDEVRRKITDPKESVADYFLSVREGRGGSNIKGESDARARALLDENPVIAELFNRIAAALKYQIVAAKKTADANCRAALGLSDEEVDSGSRPHEFQDSREYLAYYYQNYDEFDRIIFPILYGSEIGEALKVDIIRISPEAATALIDERETGCHKLAGPARGNFGVFLDQLWRKNDSLWGRLDGAERIIRALLPDDPTLARMLVGEAHAAIVNETIDRLGETEARDLLCESAMRTRSRSAEPELLKQFIGNLKTHDAAHQLDDLIYDKALRQHYINTFDTRSRLDPESTLKTAARATAVISQMLTPLTASRNIDSSSVTPWIARVARSVSSLVAVSLPGSTFNVFLRHWLPALYLFEAFLIYAGFGQIGWRLLGMTVAVNIAIWWMKDFYSASAPYSTSLFCFWAPSSHC